MNTKRNIYLLLLLLSWTGVSAQITEQSPVITAPVDSLKRAKGALPVYSTSAETYMQIINYSWHIRGGLLGINLDGSAAAAPNSTEKDLFSYKLEYETAGQWSGNIGKQTWNHVSGTTPVGLRSYTFTYDGLSRLKTAAYSGQGSESYGIPNMNYDRNGNITQLQRNGKTGGSFGLMDNLTYTYSGNRLTAVNDAVSGNYEVDFVKRGSGGYTYYANGALKTDENEEITNIVYNTYLNLPEEITLTGGRWIKYTYDGEGKLLKTEYSTGEYWEYVDEFVFKNGQPYQVAIPDGRATYASGNWVKEFDYKDHLGNTRVSFKEGSTGVVQTAKTDFDPWGVRLNGTGSVNAVQNRWELQDKEKEMTFNLNRINFGERVYNPTIGRFLSIDPRATEREWLSPYNYVQNNPIMRIDPDGAFDDYALTANGSINLVKKTDDNFDRITSTKNPDKSITVTKGVLNKVVDVNQTNFSYNDAQEIFVTGNNSEAQRVFEFAAENSNVEFGLTTIESKSGIQVSVLRTDHKPGSVGISHFPKLEAAGFEIKDIKHSHPGGPGTPSGFNDMGQIDKSAVKKGDLKTARNYPNATHSLYDTKTKSYTRYDQNKVYPPK